LNTRFLGDLYQDLSEAARKKYALLQTPIFVEEFILDRTLTPAVNEFGFQNLRLIDPTCGSGHFLLGAFERLFTIWQQYEPLTNPRKLARNALDSVYGVDSNPFAVAIARFRLLIAALKACEETSLENAPGFEINLAVGDSLLMERFFDLAVNGSNGDRMESAGFVGMITANSFMKREFGKKLIETYIPRWDLTHVIDTSGAYIPGHGTPTVILFGRNQRPIASAIRTAMGIKGEPETPDNPAQGLVWTAIVNQLDLPDSQSEFISVGDTKRESFHSHPWSIGGGGAAELKDQLDEAGEKKLGDVVDVIGVFGMTNADEVMLAPHRAFRRCKVEDEVIKPLVLGDQVRDYLITLDGWVTFPYRNGELIPVDGMHHLRKWLWPSRTELGNRATFSKRTYFTEGRAWWEWHQVALDRLRTPFSITFAEVATHNHFVLDRGGKVFKQTAPVVKLPADATEDQHLALLGLLNSSTACFWMKQVFQNKGSTVDERGARQRTMPFEDFYQHNGTGLKNFPIPENEPLSLARTLDQLAQELQSMLPNALAARATPNAEAWRRAEAEADRLREQMIALQEELDWQCYQLYGLVEEKLFVVPPSGGELEAQSQPPEVGTTNVNAPGIRLGERAFGIMMARKMAAGELETTWFDRHGSTPITELPAHWPEEYRRLVECRIEMIESDRNINLIERPEYKRRWNSEPWAEQAERALRNWLLDSLEDARYWPEVALTSASRLADRVRADAEFMQVAEMYRGRPDFDLTKLVTELVTTEAVPFLPVFRYKPSGLEKRALWERTWDLQRQEDRVRDAIEEECRKRIAEKKDGKSKLDSYEPEIRKLVAEVVGDISVPPKYASKDFQSATYWRLRGKLDVPKERFVSFPKCERDANASQVIGWAGWDHLDQARAIAGYYESMRANEGWSPERLTPLLAGLIELLPWLKQWHNEMDPAYGVGMGDFFENFVEGEARAMGKTVEAIKMWKP